MGDIDNAKARLEKAWTSIKATENLALAPIAQVALGELEYESGKPRAPEARAYFKKAAALWTDDLPDAASVEATCYQGALEMPAGRARATGEAVERGMEQAKRMGRFNLEHQCRLQLAQVHFAERRYAEVVKELNDIPLLGGERPVGSELQAEVHYWRSRAMAARADRTGAELEAAAAEAVAARKSLKDLQASLPAPYRDGFASRVDIRRILQYDPVREGR
jgi:hypothetical protein